jgi:hypothetical protein
LGYITDTLQPFKSTGKSIDPIAMIVVEYLSSKVFQIQIPTDFRGLIKWRMDDFLALSGNRARDWPFLAYATTLFRLIKSQVRGSYAREKVNEHFPIVSGDCTLHDDSYGCFAVANASIDREIWTNKGDLARVTKYGNILMVLLGVATMNNLE